MNAFAKFATDFEQKILPLFEMHRREWLEKARRAALEIGRRKIEVTINGVREMIPPPGGVDPRVMGAVFVCSQWKLLRHERSNRATCHGRPVGVFTLRAR